MDDVKKCTSYIHYRYALGILTLVLIWTFVERYVGEGELVDKINFAASIASLILAVVAIVYSMIESTKSQSLIAKLDSASTSIETVASKALASADEIKKSSEKVSKISDEMLLKMDGLPLVVESKMKDIFHVNTTVPSKAQEGGAKNYANAIIEDCPPGGLLFFRALHLSYVNKKKFDLEKLVEKMDLGLNDHAQGFFFATRHILGTFGLIKIKGPDHRLIVTEFDEGLFKDWDSAFEKSMESTPEDSKDRLKKAKDAVDEYFK